MSSEQDHFRRELNIPAIIGFGLFGLILLGRAVEQFSPRLLDPLQTAYLSLVNSVCAKSDIIASAVCSILPK